jgi:hypothetical protein
LIYIKEKDTGFFVNRKAKESDKNWERILRSKSTNWGRNMRATASPPLSERAKQEAAKQAKRRQAG